MSGVTYLQESEGYAKYDTTSYKGRIGARQDKLPPDVFSNPLSTSQNGARGA